VHGDEGVKQAEAATQALFSGDVSAMSVRELLEVFPDVPSSSVSFSSEGWGIVDLLASAGVTSSKGEATRLVRSGGIYVNGRRIGDEKHRLRMVDAVEGQLFVIRKGKRDHFLVRVTKG
jgi:tyrosyl-tRNA synthetase